MHCNWVRHRTKVEKNVVLRVNRNVAAIITCAILNRGLSAAAGCYARRITSGGQTER